MLIVMLVPVTGVDMLLLIMLTVICQVWLISYFYPKKIVKRMNYILENFPENQYPKLYPISEKKLNGLKQKYIWFNHVLMIVGIMIILYFTLFVDDYSQYMNKFDDLPLLFGIAQFIPLFMLEIFGLKHLKKMREQFNNSQRQATLQPRRVFDYIAPKYIYLAVFAYVSFILFELGLNQFTFTADVIVKLTSLTLANLLFIGISAANLYGKKKDPYQNEIDRTKQIKFSLKSFTFISIFMSIYLLFHSLVNIYDFNLLEILINSLYFQLIALFSTGAILNCYKVEKLNFDGYKS